MSRDQKIQPGSDEWTRIIETFEITQQVLATAKATNHSRDAVRRVLVEAGLFVIGKSRYMSTLEGSEDWNAPMVDARNGIPLTEQVRYLIHEIRFFADWLRLEAVADRLDMSYQYLRRLIAIAGDRHLQKRAEVELVDKRVALTEQEPMRYSGRR